MVHAVFVAIGSLIILVGFLGKYAFANPDANAWYVVINDGSKDGMQNLSPSHDAAYATTSMYDTYSEDPTNAHGPFVRWFLWGFTQFIAQVACFYWAY